MQAGLAATETLEPQLHPSGALKQPVSRLPCPGLLAHTSLTTALNDSLRACVSAMPQDAQRHLGSAGISVAAEAAACQREDLSRAVVSTKRRQARLLVLQRLTCVDSADRSGARC